MFYGLSENFTLHCSVHNHRPRMIFIRIEQQIAVSLVWSSVYKQQI